MNSTVRQVIKNETLAFLEAERQAVCLNREFLERALNMEGWTYWARERGVALGYTMPSWAKQMESGYPEEPPPKPLFPINDDYGLYLEGLMSRLPAASRKILFMLYVLKSSFSTVRREVSCSNDEIKDTRNSALAYLYGMKTGSSENA